MLKQKIIIQLAGWLARYHSDISLCQSRLRSECWRNGKLVNTKYDHHGHGRSVSVCQWNNSIAVGGWARPSNLLKV